MHFARLEAERSRTSAVAAATSESTYARFPGRDERPVGRPYTALIAYLAAYVHRRRRRAVAGAVGWGITTLVGWVLLACFGDRWFEFRSGVRFILLAIAVAGPALIAACPLGRSFRRRFDPIAAAAAIERDHPAFAHRLVTAASPGGSLDLRAAVERDVLDLIAAAGPARVPRRPAAIAVSAAVVTLALFALLWRWPWLDLPDLTRRLLRPNAPIAAVTTTRLSVRPGPADVVEGKPLAITAAVTGPVGPAGVVLHVSDDGGQSWTDHPTSPAPAGYAATLADVDRDLLYTVSAGDAVSPAYAVRVRRTPAVVAVRVRLDYPPDLHRPPASTADLAVNAPAGTTATVEIVATVPLRRATLTVGPDRIEMVPTADPCARRAQFVVRRDERIGVQLVSADGVPGTGPRWTRVHVDRDTAGTVPGFEQQQRAYRDAIDHH